jgi:hypothetical protein
MYTKLSYMGALRETRANSYAKRNPEMQFKNRQCTLDQIAEFKIASGDIAKLAEVDIQRISDFKADRRVEPSKAAKIADAADKIYTVLSELRPVRVDTRDPENILRALAELQKVKTAHLVAETAQFAAQASEGLNATCSVTGQKKDF